jgi:succinate dehydrogenase flavin-adding protein (antitoxin of CptAB toxin-antitoxin module)
LISLSLPEFPDLSKRKQEKKQDKREKPGWRSAVRGVREVRGEFLVFVHG